LRERHDFLVLCDHVLVVRFRNDKIARKALEEHSGLVHGVLAASPNILAQRCELSDGILGFMVHLDRRRIHQNLLRGGDAQSVRAGETGA
jgi:hypothetical protein